MGDRLELYAELRKMSPQDSIKYTKRHPFPYIELYANKNSRNNSKLSNLSGTQMGEKLHLLAGKIRNREHAHMHPNTLNLSLIHI